jgi:hypothetical protein
VGHRRDSRNGPDRRSEHQASGACSARLRIGLALALATVAR